MLRVLIVIILILALIPTIAACIWEPDECSAGPPAAVLADAGGLDGSLNVNCGANSPPVGSFRG